MQDGTVTMQKRPRTRSTMGLVVGGGMLIFVAANAHLVYVALTSQPECVEHLREAGSKAGEFRAAKSAC